MLILGIDDAGRGPLIGPMVLAGAVLDENGETFLKNHNVTDSKMLSHPTRVRLSKIIQESSLGYKVVQTTAEQIDASLNSGTNLNTLEAMKAAEIINSLNDGKEMKVVIDCPSVNLESWHATLLEYIENPDNLTISCEHKADANHISVSAASILAKCKREEEVAKLKEQYGAIGSGYPSDPTTKEFLKERGKELENSGIFRKTWSTWKKLYPDNSQETLF